MNPTKLAVALVFIFCNVLMLASCEKEVKLNLSTGELQLVVNGQIELNEPPFVVLTRSIGYFSKVDLKTLQESFIHDAEVWVSDGSRSVRLREYSVDTSSNTVDSARFYFYSLDIDDPAAISFRGEAEKFYTLSIESGDRKYTSITKIPAPRPIDSMRAVAPREAPANAPTAMQLMVWYSDPDTVGNAVRYFTKRNSEAFYPGPNSVFDDQVVNGTRNASFPLQVGGPRSNIDFSDSTGYVFRGDTLTLRWSAIDMGVFNFYSTFEYSIGTVGNPFSTPINVQSNVANGALGIWAGYGSSYTTIVVPK